MTSGTYVIIYTIDNALQRKQQDITSHLHFVSGNKLYLNLCQIPPHATLEHCDYSQRCYCLGKSLAQSLVHELPN